MKPKAIITMLLIAFSTAAFAQSKKVTDASKTVCFSEAVTSLTVNDNITVVLTDNSAASITIQGDAKSVDIRMDEGHIELSAQGNLAHAVVYVPAASLSKVFLNGNGALRSASVLSNGKMKIFMGGEATVNVRSVGAVVLETNDDIRFVKASR